MIKALTVSAVLVGHVSATADFEPSTKFASLAVATGRAMKKAERAKLHANRALKSRPKSSADGGKGSDTHPEPTRAPTAAPTRAPTAAPTYGTETNFNDLTFNSKQVYYSKVLQPKERVIVYEDDVFSVYANCHAQGDNNDPASIDVVVRNLNAWDITASVDYYWARGNNYDDDDNDDGNDANNDSTEDIAVRDITAGAARLFQGVNYNWPGDTNGDYTGIDSGIFLNDGHFLASFGEASIIIDNWSPKDENDNDEYYGGDIIVGDDVGCIFAGFLEIASPNENFLPISINYAGNNFGGGALKFDGKDASFSGHDSTTASGSSGGIGSVTKFAMSAVAGVFGAFAALYVSRKRIARVANGAHSVDTVDEKNGVVSF